MGSAKSAARRSAKAVLHGSGARPLPHPKAHITVILRDNGDNTVRASYQSSLPRTGRNHHDQAPMASANRTTGSQAHPWTRSSADPKIANASPTRTFAGVNSQNQ